MCYSDMKKISLRLLCPLILVLLTSYVHGQNASVSNAIPPSETARLQSALSQALTKLGQYQTQERAALNQVAALRVEVKSLKAQVLKLTEGASDLQDTLTLRQGQLVAAEKDLINSRSQLEQEKVTVSSLEKKLKVEKRHTHRLRILLFITIPAAFIVGLAAG